MSSQLVDGSLRSPDPSSSVARGTLLVQEARRREAPRPDTPFRHILAGSVNVLMSGAEAATGTLGGPLLAAAVRQTRADVVGGLTGTPPGTPAPGPGGAAGLAGAAAGAEGTELAALHAMQRESQAFNLQLLELQEEVQQESRRFSTTSNVLRAWHDTARAAVNNIRS